MLEKKLNHYESLKSRIIIEDGIAIWKEDKSIPSERYLDFLHLQGVITDEQYFNTMDAGDNQAQDERRGL